MKTFICILALAVASCKAGFDYNAYANAAKHGLSSAASEDSHKTYDFTPSQHGGQLQHFSGQSHQVPQVHEYQQQEQPHDFSGHNQGNAYAAALAQLHAQEAAKSADNHNQGQVFSFHSGAHFPQFQAYNLGHDNGFAGSNGHEAQHFDFSQQEQHPQARGFDVSGHGDVSSYDSSGHGATGGDSYLQAAHELGHDASNNDGEKGHEEEQKGFVLQDASQEYGHGQQEGDNSNHIQGEGQGQFEGHDFSGHDFGGHDFGGHDGGHDSGHEGQNFGHEGHDFGGHDNTFAVGTHTDTEHPVPVANYKHVTVPIHKPIQVNVPKPILIGVPQPYPVKVPVHKPVAVPVETEINIPIEKVKPYPVIKHVPYPVEKHVPIKVEKTVTVHVPKPYPVKIPVYKTIHHYSKDH